jgi:uncharacterized protein
MKQWTLYCLEQIQRGVTRLARHSYDHPWLVGLLLIMLLAIPISQVSRLKRDGSVEGFLRVDDKSLVAYNQFRHQFGQDGEIVIAIQSSNIFTQEFLADLKKFHLALEQNVPFIEDMTSLYNARDVKGRQQDFVVENLLLHWPQNESALRALREKVMTNPIYRNLLIDPQGRMTTITIKPDRYSHGESNGGLIKEFVSELTPAMLAEDRQKHRFLSAQELGRMVASVQRVAAQFDKADFRINIAGAPTASSTIVQLLLSDMGKYMMVSVAVILLLIGVFTRRYESSILAAVVIALTLFSTFGLMAISGVAIKPPTQVLLSIILVASICELIHITTAFFLRLQKTQCKRTALLDTIEHSAVPVMFTTLTNAAGLFAFCASDLAPIADLGWFGAMAVLMAMLITWVVVPIVVRILPIKPKRSNWGGTLERAPRWAVHLATFSGRHRGLMVLMSLPVLLILLFGVTKVRFEHNSLLWLPEHNSVRVATQEIDHVLGGTVNLEVVLDTGKEFGVQDAAFLRDLEIAARELPQSIHSDVQVGKVVSVVDVLKELNQGLHGGGAEQYRLPDARMIGQAFVLFENSSSNALPYLVDSNYQKTRVTIRVPWLEASLYTDFISKVENYFTQRMGGGVAVQATGIMALIACTSTAVMQSLASSYFGSLILIPLLMILLLGSVRMGLVSMVPNVLPIVMVLGLMGYLHIPLDTFSMMAGSIALGLIVDDSVHFFHTFANAYRRRADVEYAITATIEETGRSIVNASFTLASAFGTYMFAAMNNVRDFGLVMVLTILLALLSDLILSPALLSMVYVRRVRQEAEKNLPVQAPVPQTSSAEL